MDWLAQFFHLKGDSHAYESLAPVRADQPAHQRPETPSQIGTLRAPVLLLNERWTNRRLRVTLMY